MSLPGSFLIDSDGSVLASFVETDYRTRLEPAVALAWIDGLSDRITA